MSELFDIPEQLSPRLAWLRDIKALHGVKTERCTAPHTPEPWAAYIGDMVDAIENNSIQTGNTEIEAVILLARANNWKLWNEEKL